MIRFADTHPEFGPGDLVRHRQYGYRGIVVAADLRCRADHDWYIANRTQPDQNQPWYHVLVDGSASTTYAAESSLESDDSQDPIDHPLVSQFFYRECNGRYVRNDQPWKGW